MDETERRAEIARRLKAARWLAGSYRRKPGKESFEPIALSAEELASRDSLESNGITAYRIGTIERMEHHTPPMELDAIADALGIARGYFHPEDGLPALPITGQVTPTEVADLLRRQTAILERLEVTTSRADGAAEKLSGLVEEARKGLPPAVARGQSGEGAGRGTKDSRSASS